MTERPILSLYVFCPIAVTNLGVPVLIRNPILIRRSCFNDSDINFNDMIIRYSLLFQIVNK